MTAEEAGKRKAARDRIQRKKEKTDKTTDKKGSCQRSDGCADTGNRFTDCTDTPGEAGKAVRSGDFLKKVANAPELDVQLLTPNPYSRPRTAMEEIKGLVIHYVANPGTTAQQNRNYFEGLKDSRITKASSHFIIGLEGEIIQCIPSSEIAYASNERNVDTLSIECCHPDETGKFSKETYDSLVHLTAWICGKFNLTTEDVIRHYDVTGKQCPLYYVENQDAWEQFLKDVQNYIEKNGVKEKEMFS